MKVERQVIVLTHDHRKRHTILFSPVNLNSFQTEKWTHVLLHISLSLAERTVQNKSRYSLPAYGRE